MIILNGTTITDTESYQTNAKPSLPMWEVQQQAQDACAARHSVGQVAMTNEHIPHLVALFNQLDERGQKTTLAMLAVAVKLHPKVKP